MGAVVELVGESLIEMKLLGEIDFVGVYFRWNLDGGISGGASIGAVEDFEDRIFV